MARQTAPTPCQTEIFVFINHVWLCAAMVSQCQPVLKWVWPKCYKTLNLQFGKFAEGQKHFTKSKKTTINKYINLNKSLKTWFSILLLFTFKSCYKKMVLTSPCFSIAWNTSKLKLNQYFPKRFKSWIQNKLKTADLYDWGLVF